MYYDIFILSSLMQKPMYGYEIRKSVKDGFSVCSRISNNSLYPLLKKFEKNGYITQTVQVQTGKPNRICYRITGEGRRFFLQTLNTIPESLQYNRDDFFMRLLYFHLIKPVNRKRILDGRKKYLEQGIHIIQTSKTPEGKFAPRTEEAAKYHLAILRLEIELIEKYEKKIHDPCVTL